MVLLVLFRRDSSDVDLGPVAVFAGLVGSFAVLGFRPVGGGEVTQTGYIMNNPSLRNLAAMAIGTGFQVVRIRYEERLLSRDEDYRRYADGVRWHLVPGVW